VDDGFKKAVVVEDQPKVALYINDGVYGSFNCVVFDHAHVYPKALDARTVNTVPTKLFGPTCDSIDVVKACTNLPEMHVGDWLMFNNMGAYTRCAASRFNGQGAHDLHYIWAGMP
jgi:ornithine decarboxylase